MIISIDYKDGRTAIIKRVPQYSSDTKGKYHRYTELNKKFVPQCDMASVLPVGVILDVRYKVASLDDDIVDLPIKQLCANCFPVRNITIKVSANAGRIS